MVVGGVNSLNIGGVMGKKSQTRRKFSMNEYAAESYGGLLYVHITRKVCNHKAASIHLRSIGCNKNF